MTETFAALLLAHVIADFVFQTNWMVANKRAATPLDAHIAVVLAAVILCTGSLHPVLFALTLAYLGIDFVKTHSGAKGLLPFLLDQAAHLVTVVVAVLNPPFGLTVCGQQASLPGWMALVAGFIVATRAGGFGMGMLMAPWGAVGLGGLSGGGRIIGSRDRGMIFVLVLTDQSQSIGFPIAAKPVLRFCAVRKEARLSDDVIIGSPAPFGWSIIMAFATLPCCLRCRLLEFPTFNPRLSQPRRSPCSAFPARPLLPSPPLPRARSRG